MGRFTCRPAARCQDGISAHDQVPASRRRHGEIALRHPTVREHREQALEMSDARQQMTRKFTGVRLRKDVFRNGATDAAQVRSS